MLRTLRRRALLSLPLLLGVTTLTFFLGSLIPGNEALSILGPYATPQSVAALTRSLRLDEPVTEQYWHWLSGVLQGHLGTSLVTGEPVSSTINAALPVTLWLIGGAIVVSLLLGTTLGMLSALRGGRIDRLLSAVSFCGLAIPTFWLGYLLVLLFAARLHWLPASGYVSPTSSVVGWIRSLVLPVLTLGIGGVALIARQIRDGFLDVMNQEYVRMLHARGIGRRSILLKHALRGALPNALTQAGLLIVGLLLGTAIVETVFAMQGLGSEVVQATDSHDLLVVDGATLYFTLIVIVVFTIIDLVLAWLNPRLRSGK